MEDKSLPKRLKSGLEITAVEDSAVFNATEALMAGYLAIPPESR
jgi:hypothetical protein